MLPHKFKRINKFFYYYVHISRRKDLFATYSTATLLFSAWSSYMRTSLHDVVLVVVHDVRNGGDGRHLNHLHVGRAGSCAISCVRYGANSDTDRAPNDSAP